MLMLMSIQKMMLVLLVMLWLTRTLQTWLIERCLQLKDTPTLMLMLKLIDKHSADWEMMLAVDWCSSADTADTFFRREPPQIETGGEQPVNHYSLHLTRIITSNGSKLGREVSSLAIKMCWIFTGQLVKCFAHCLVYWSDLPTVNCWPMIISLQIKTEKGDKFQLTSVPNKIRWLIWTNLRIYSYKKSTWMNIQIYISIHQKDKNRAKFCKCKMKLEASLPVNHYSLDVQFADRWIFANYCWHFTNKVNICTYIWILSWQEIRGLWPRFS